MGFARKGVWVLGYCGPMGYGVHFPAHQVGGWPGLWVKRSYGLPEVWVKKGLTAVSCMMDFVGHKVGMNDVQNDQMLILSPTGQSSVCLCDT